MHAGQEQSALGTLDDAVVVGAGDRDDLADTERAEVGAVGALELGRVVDAPDADDDALTLHEPGDALNGADRARVGEADVGALEILDRELVRADLADQLLVGAEEAGEVHAVGLSDDRNDERARAITLVHVDGEAEVDRLDALQTGLAVVVLDERVAHVRDGVGDGPHDGVADEVGEADLARAAAGAVAVDHLAVDLEQLGGDLPEAGRRRHAEAALHVGGDHGCGAPQDCPLRLGAPGTGRRLAGARVAGGLGLICGSRRSRRGRFCGGGRCRFARRLRRRRFGRDRLVVGEELAPRLPDRLRVGAELLVHLLDQP